MNITKKQKKHLRELAGKAYERDLARCLEALKNGFVRWEADEIDVWALNDKIHDYHDNVARELYKSYVMINDPVLSVAFGIKQGVVDINEVSEECKPLLLNMLSLFNNREDITN